MEAKVLDKGFVKLLSYMGSDKSIAAAARVSHGNHYKVYSSEQDRRLIRYLTRKRHTSPFQMAHVVWAVRCPVFVARQLVRHRTFNMNEQSGRYTELRTEFYEPDVWRQQGKGHNKQVSSSEGVSMAVAADLDQAQDALHKELEKEYKRRLDAGVAKELARIDLPLSLYVEFIWESDLHNLMHMLHLRDSSHAQPETREYAKAMLELVTPLFPHTFEAFRDYVQEAVTFSRMEMEALRVLLTEGPAAVAELGNLGMRASEWGEFWEKVDVRLEDRGSQDV